MDGRFSGVDYVDLVGMRVGSCKLLLFVSFACPSMFESLEKRLDNKPIKFGGPDKTAATDLIVIIRHFEKTTTSVSKWESYVTLTMCGIKIFVLMS